MPVPGNALTSLAGCSTLEVTGAAEQDGIVGEYQMLGSDCGTQHKLYLQSDPAPGWGEAFYLYYYTDSEWSGWVFSKFLLL